MTATSPNDNLIRQIARAMLDEEGSVVFLIGAGGSASAGVPTAGDMSRYLKEYWREQLEHQIALEPEFKNLPSLDNLPLPLILYFFQKSQGNINSAEAFLKGQLSSYTSDKVFPPLGYELVAHMSKHGLIHYIISTNFDELLDESMDEEHGPTGYTRVPSHSAFASIREKIEESSKERYPNLPVPLLLKPHGTLSLSPTLRFEAGDDLLRFEDHKRIVLEHILTGRTLVIVGYGCWDQNFYNLLMSLLSGKKIKDIYVVDINGKVVKNKNTKISKLLKANRFNALDTRTSVDPIDHFINLSFDEFMKALDKEIQSDEDKGRYFPLSSRHVIRSCIFGRGQIECKISLRNKLLLELIVFSLKMRGKFSTKHLLYNDGIEYYLNEIIRNKELLRKDSFDSNIDSARDVLEILVNEKVLTLVPIDFENEDFRINDPGTHPAISIENMCFLKLPIGGPLIGMNEENGDIEGIDLVIDGLVTSIIEKLPQLFSFENTEIEKSVKKEIHDAMASLIRKFDYDLQISSHPYDFSFHSPKHISSKIEYRDSRVSLEIFANAVVGVEKLDVYIISETGKWLVDQVERLRERFGKEGGDWAGIKSLISAGKIHVIISDPEDDLAQAFSWTMSQHYYSKLKDIFGTQNIKLLDWRSNRHLGVFSEGRCLYVYREGKAPTLLPIELDDPRDVAVMMEIAKNAWEKATAGKNGV